MIVQWRKLELDEKIEKGDLLCSDDKSPADMHKVRRTHVRGLILLENFVVSLHRLNKSDVGKTVKQFRTPHVCYWPWRAEGVEVKPEVETQQNERKIQLEL